jgi:hypothetical protein
MISHKLGGIIEVTKESLRLLASLLLHLAGLLNLSKELADLSLSLHVLDSATIHAGKLRNRHLLGSVLRGDTLSEARIRHSARKEGEIKNIRKVMIEGTQ